MTTKKVLIEGDAAKELVLAATGNPYFIAVAEGDKTLMRWSDGFNVGTLLDLIAELAEQDKNFKNVFCNFIIDYSKNL